MNGRSLLISMVLLVTSTMVNANTRSWEFEVYLDDDLIGQHNFVLSDIEGRQQVEIKANFDVRILFFTAYQYRHTNREIWQGKCLQRIESQTNDNGSLYQVSGQQQAQEFQLTINQKSTSLSGCVQSFFYWDPAIINQTQLLNSQTGEYETVTIKKIGNQDLTISDKLVNANHYQIKTSKFTIELWYSAEGEWLALRSTTADGNILNYKLKRGTS